MKLTRKTGAIVLACALAAPAASAAPLAPATVEVETALIHHVGYRHDRSRDFGGITYTGTSGLKYAPAWHRHRRHGDKVTVKVYIGTPKPPKYRQQAQPLIIDLPD